MKTDSNTRKHVAALISHQERTTLQVSPSMDRTSYQALKQILLEATYRLRRKGNARLSIKLCTNNIHLKKNTVVTTNKQQKDFEQPASPTKEGQAPTPSIGTKLQLINDDDYDQQMIDGHGNSEYKNFSPPTPPRRYRERHQQPLTRVVYYYYYY